VGARGENAAAVPEIPTLLERFCLAIYRPSSMYAIAILRYRRPLDEVLPVVDAHRAYLKGLRDDGILLASGPFEPRAGGALLLRVADDGALAALDRVRDGDPFTKLGLAQYELLPWAPTFGKEELDRAFVVPPRVG